MHFHLSTTPENRGQLKTLSFEKVTAVLGEGCMSCNARKTERNSRSEPLKQTHILIRGALSVHTYPSAEMSRFSHIHTLTRFRYLKEDKTSSETQFALSHTLVSCSRHVLGAN